MCRDGDLYMFVRWENIYIYDTKHSLCTSTVHQMQLSTQEEKFEMRKLADSSPASMTERLRVGSIANTTLTPSDVWRSIDTSAVSHLKRSKARLQAIKLQ
jgi:hypothetical protein